MHLSAEKNQIAPNVVLPGDPLRAKFMASQYLTDAMCVNQIRGMLAYTGFYKGQRISIVSTGMGIPSMMIYATELCKEYECKKMVRMGTCGSFKRDIALGDILLSQATSTTSSINDYHFPGHYSPTADFDLLYKAYNLANDKKLRVHVGQTICNDHLYIEDKLDYSQIWAQYGVIGSELEGAGLYTVAARYEAKALMMVSVVMNMFDQSVQISTQEKETGMINLMELSLDTVLD